MKYKDLIQFESLDEVVKFNRLEEPDYRRNTVSSYVFSETYEKNIIPEICRNLDYTSSLETFGLQIIGTYGTGKSHLMSLISLIGENAEYLPLVKSEIARKVLGNIAGKYMVVRFELGGTNELWNLITYQIDKQFANWGIDYSITGDSTPDMYKDKLNRMMAQFETAYPDRGLMIVIDEMLSYLKGRGGNDQLNRDLAVIQALGETSDHTKFRFIYGVQEQIYNVPEFQFAANMLNQVSQRYRPIQITKQDVQFVTQQRILRKSEAQKQTIREHLAGFAEYFTDMHNKLDEYVNLFPVHPAFFENFQLIKIAKSQREILKTLSRKFADIADQEIPTDQPGLISYDSYWTDLQVPAMQTYPDIRRVTEIMATINQKIDENFVGPRASKKAMAHRIANACAVKVLQDSLEKTNGANAETLADDLCLVSNGCLDRDFMIDNVATTANQIVQATVGQYFEKNNTNQEFHLRVEGGVNYEQKIKDFALTMTDDQKDSFFFSYLAENLPIEEQQYRREFKIFAHHLDWKSHKVQLDGYIFMGNPNQRSTTQPEQSFYLYFMPIFNKKNIKHGDEADSVYFHFDHVSSEMKELLELYAASEALIASVDSSQKPFYQQFKKRYTDQLRPIFDEEFRKATEVYYMGEKQTITPAMMSGGSKEEIVNKIASTLLEDHFCNQMPNYPKFTLLGTVLTNTNRQTILKGARMKIATPSNTNRDGEAILAGLGLLKENQLKTEGSIYAINIRQKLEDKGEGQVLNRDEILYRFFKDWNDDWRTKDYHLPADLEFLVLATMVAMGEIEIEQGGKSINAANLKEVVDLPKEAFYSFSHVRKPKDLNMAAVRELFLGIVGKDYSTQLDNKAIYEELTTEAKKLAHKAVKAQNDIAMGIKIGSVSLLDSTTAVTIKNDLAAFSGLCDRVQSFITPAKLRHLPEQWTAQELRKKFETKQTLAHLEELGKLAKEFEPQYNYLQQAKQYTPDGSDIKQKIEAVLRLFDGIEPKDVGTAKINNLRNELAKVIGEYADWYLAEYKRMHISAFDDTQRRKLCNSPMRTICQEVCKEDQDTGYFSVGSQYQKWEEDMAQLRMSDPSVTRDYLLHTPYARFNPAQYVGKQLPSLADMETRLEQLAGNVEMAMSTILNDDSLHDKVDLLDNADQVLYTRFTSKSEDLSPENAARLTRIVKRLHEDIRRINISASELSTQVFNRPMTPDETIAAFRKYIKDQTVGSDSNVRITFKG